MDPKAEVLTWAAATSRKERLDFLKEYLDICQFEEFKDKGIQRLVENSKKRKHRSEERESKRIKGESTAPVQPLGSPVSVEEPWWVKFRPENIFSMDCEMVTILKPAPDEDPCKAAKVSLVRMSDKQVIYEASVKHGVDTFIVDKWTLRTNGIRSGDLKKGQDLETVSKEVDEIIRGEDNLVVTCGGKNDFSCLGLFVTEYNVFDILNHWKKWNGTCSKLGIPNMNTIGLRSLACYYLHSDIQKGAHSSTIDAIATIELFEIYTQIKTTNISKKVHNPGILEFKDITTVNDSNCNKTNSIFPDHKNTYEKLFKKKSLANQLIAASESKGLSPRNPPRNTAYNRDRGGDTDRPGGDRDGYQNRREQLISRSSSTLNDETGSVDGHGRRPVNTYPDANQLFVGNLPHFVTQQDMKDIFSEFGEVAEVKIQKPMPKNTGVKVPYFCFVVFEEVSSAQLAIEKKEEIFMKLNGGAQRRLNVEPKRSERPGRSGGDHSPAGNRLSDEMRSQSRTFRGFIRGGGMSCDRDRNMGRGGERDGGGREN